jgi:PAS domain S-box-containing protein
MKIKTQFILCILVFSLILLVIAVSVAITEQQVSQLNIQEEISNNIERGASSLNSVSIDYFLYQEDLQLSRWQSVLSSLSSDLESLKSSYSQQQTYVNNVAEDLQSLSNLFDNVVSYLQSASRNVSVRIDPEFQLRWSSMAAQSQALAFDASQLSLLLDNQAHQLNDTNILLIISLVSTFGAFLATIYLMVFRRTLKSVADLQKGINTIGSGNLNYAIKIEGKNEITELSHAFNQMATSLKTVTASKTDLEQTQASLRASEQRWSTTLASIGDAVIATDLSGKITFMNSVAQELTGWTMDDASLKHVKQIFNIVNEQTRLEVENPVSKVLERGVIVGLANHTLLIKKDGAEIPIDDSGAPIKDNDGKNTGVVLIFRDISENKKTEKTLLESEERFSKAFHNSPVPQIITRCGDWKFIDANDSVLHLLEYSREELIGHSSAELKLIASENRNKGASVEENGGLREFETELRTKSGKIMTVLASTETITLNGKKHLINTFIDITIRKQMQEKLEEYNKHLEELVEERTKQLKDSERLAAIGATAGMVGHDIRNPLQAITGDLYLAKTELATIPESEEKKNAVESLSEIEKNIDYINKIVADLQDFARPLKPHIEEADLKQIISELLEKNGLPENIKIKVKVDGESQKVLSDSAYINRIMYNLITNAVQAMPKGGKLTINAYKDKKTDEAVITVTDTGVGIPEAVKEKLFTPMFTTKSKGQGFGLAVIKRMAVALNGNVVFESQEGNGTTFTVRLPQNFKRKQRFN